MKYAEIGTSLARHGLIARGGFHPEAGDRVPPLPGGRPARSVILAGNAGPGLWAICTRAPEFANGAPDPLDSWSARILESLAVDLGALALFPFGGPPYLPFVAWAKRAEPVAESPLGILIHPDHGLWHAYRGALAFAERIEMPARDVRVRPCDTCLDRPCLTACPVGAFSSAGYDVPSCVKHISTPEGADCMDLGCRARRACPIGRSAAHEKAQARFHMEAFLRARREDKVPK